MISLLELRISDEGFAVFAPILWLMNISNSLYRGKITLLTVDFQYSDIVERPEDDLPDEDGTSRTGYSATLAP